jgi:hypothetical protein
MKSINDNPIEKKLFLVRKTIATAFAFFALRFFKCSEAHQENRRNTGDSLDGVDSLV